MKKNFDALKAVRSVQGADMGGSRGNEGNVNPSAQDQDRTATVVAQIGTTSATGYNAAAAKKANFDGDVGHDYTERNHVK